MMIQQIFCTGQPDVNSHDLPCGTDLLDCTIPETNTGSLLWFVQT